MVECRKCKKEYPREDFRKKMSGTLGRWCSCCRKAYKKQNNAKHAESRARKERERHASLKECPLVWRRELDKRNRYKKTPIGRAISLSATRARQAGLRTATPTWVNRKQLNDIYKNCPPGYHVDHVIPLNNELVCGLHVPWNLQYLNADDNVAKSNTLPSADQLVAKVAV